MSRALVTKALAAGSVLATVALAAWVAACYGDNVDSVHFYGSFGEPDVDFGRVPQKWMAPGWNNEVRRGGTKYGWEQQEVYDERLGLEAFGDGLDEWDDQGPARFAKKVRAARNREVQNDFKTAVDMYGETAETRSLKSFVQDRKELIREGLDSDDLGVGTYLRERYLIEFGNPKEKERAVLALRNLKAGTRLRPHVEYAVAAATVYPDRRSRAEAFVKVADLAPKAPRAESALVMAARSWLEDASGERPDVVQGEPVLRRLLRQFPETRFRGNVLGWLARCRAGQGDAQGALALYVRQSASSDPSEAWKGHAALAERAESEGRIAAAVVHGIRQRSLEVPIVSQRESAKELRRLFRSLTSDQSADVQRAVRSDPTLVGPYLTFRLEDTAMDVRQERNLLRFAASCLNGARNVGPDAFPRLAQLAYDCGSYSQGLRWARAGRSARGRSKDRALYCEAACLSRLGRRSEALRVFERLYRRGPEPYVKQSTAENLALLHEKVGDPVRAFALYDEWGYEDDAAVMADAVLTPKQLERAARTVKDPARRTVLEFTLAMRYFRIGEYRNAHRILASMPQPLRTRGGLSKDRFLSMREYVYDGEPPKIVDPLADVDALWALRQKAEAAHGQEARAEALYDMARYVHDRRNLMFYSPGLWEGRRATSFSVFWNPRVNTGAWGRKVRAYGYEHECYAHVVRLCEELVERCPRSNLVPKALYTAGVAAERLSRFNTWWEPESAGLTGKAIGLMRRLAVRYPNSVFAKDANKYAAEWKSSLDKPDWNE
ncbi:MAG: tetratricopeptide repeat protein [Armatimonadetes bacterium]|nr:tetratricopeptide repeat protein [Armatimonadota bacterium]